jgi:two-component system cell cycle response regulator
VVVSEKINVVLIEDNPGDARLVEEMLKDGGTENFEITQVESLEEGMFILSERRKNQVILLDLGLPDASGLQTLRRIVSFDKNASVVVLTGLQNEELGTRALREGALDYLIKGQIEGCQLRRIIHHAIERHRIQQELQRLAHQDELTGLHNRGGFKLLAEQQIKVSRRNHLDCLLLLFDLDRLKVINDTWGHAEGDKAIAEAAEVLRASFRNCDILGRIGGDEFAALAVGAPKASEAALRAHVREECRKVNSHPPRKYSLSMSIGAIECKPTNLSSVEELLAKADSLMYQDKKRRTGSPCADLAGLDQ